MKDVIDRTEGMEWTDVYCDNCQREKSFDIADYYDINKELREQGWIVANINGEWLDFCSHTCKAGYEWKLRNRSGK